jgi:hypothetical protein
MWMVPVEVIEEAAVLEDESRLRTTGAGPRLPLRADV